MPAPLAPAHVEMDAVTPHIVRTLAVPIQRGIPIFPFVLYRLMANPVLVHSRAKRIASSHFHVECITRVPNATPLVVSKELE